jgi:hypothetical protein
MSSDDEIHSEKDEVIEDHKVLFPSRRLFSKSGESLPCIVCKIAPSKYRFKCCRFGYCSTGCFSAHTSCETREERPFVRRRYIDPLADLELPEEDIVPKELLEKLIEDKRVKEFLENPKLREILFKIDSCKDRHSALERFMDGDPAFLQVMDIFADILQCKKAGLAD